MTTKTFTAVIHQEDDLYVADCPEVGTVSQGHTVDEAIACSTWAVIWLVNTAGFGKTTVASQGDAGGVFRLP
jgi:hypothetical protein